MIKRKSPTVARCHLVDGYAVGYEQGWSDEIIRQMVNPDLSTYPIRNARLALIGSTKPSGNPGTGKHQATIAALTSRVEELEAAFEQFTSELGWHRSSGQEKTPEMPVADRGIFAQTLPRDQ